MFLPEKLFAFASNTMLTYECKFTSSSRALPLLTLSTVGSWTVTVLPVLSTSTQISSPSFGNLSHLKLSGHAKPKRFIGTSQPCLALLQRKRQGGTGNVKFVDTEQYGACTEQIKNAKSLEQPTLTKAVNWCTSRAASCCDVWFNMFGNIVWLYSRPWQSGIVSGSQIPWACEDNTKLSAQITPRTTPGPTFALTRVVNISALWTMSSEMLSHGEK